MPPPLRIPVLMYHSIAARMTSTFREYTVTTARLREHLAALHAGGWQTLTFSEAVARLRDPARAGHGRPAVALTFDDGFADFLDALEILREHRASATLYVPTAHVGRRAGWLTGSDADRPLLTWAALTDIQDTGVEIGSHGHQHAALDLGPPDRIEQDLLTSRLMLEDRLGVPVTTLAYPYGHHTGKTRRAALRAGYGNACTVTGLAATSGDPVLAMPRLAVTQDLDGAALTAQLAARTPPWQRPWAIGKQHLWNAARKIGRIGPQGLDRSPRRIPANQDAQA
nr:polysaccharide deacetylase family protein [uncultured Actinoplanes sp.]